MLIFRRITYDEVEMLRNMTLRKADIEELRVSSGKQPWDALKSAVLHSTEWTEVGYVEETGEIIALFGLASANGIGIPWMVASPNIKKYNKILMRYSKKVIGEMNDQFTLLTNFVDSRNSLHIRWLKHMGFKFSGIEHKIDGIPFKQFYMERD